MSETSVKLTKRAIEREPAASSRRIIWDTDLRGFGMRIEPSGTRTFLVRYRPKGTGRAGAKRFITIGRYGAMTPEQARAKAKVALGRVANGEDPAVEAQRAREALTVSQMVDRYLEEHVAPLKKPSTVALYSHYLRGKVVPELGVKKVAKVTHADVLKLRAGIGKTAGQVTANRVVAALSGLFTYSVKVGEAESNPARGVEAFKERARERYLSPEELGRLGDVLREADTVGLAFDVDEAKPNAKHAPKPENRRRKPDPFGVAAIRLLLLTGARLRETLHARWEWFDADRGSLRLPDSKTGAKSIYLSTAAKAVLNGLPRLAGNPFIFPGTKVGEPRADLKKPWQAVAKAAGLKGVRLHDLRHTFASYGAGERLGLHVIGGLLGHAQAKTTQRYAHLDADPMHRAANAIGSALSAALDRTAGADVVPIRKATG